MLKAIFDLEIITFLSWVFGYVEKWVDKKVKDNFKIYVTDWTTNNYTTRIAQYSGTNVNQAVKLGQLIEYNLGGWEIFFFKNDAENEARTLVPGLFFVFKKGLYKVKTTTQYLSFSISS